MQIVQQHQSRQTARRPRRWAIRLLAWMIVACVSALWSSSAEASCGDYLHRPLNWGLQIQAENRDQSSPSDQSEHGPSCRKSSGETPIIPPVVAAEPTEEWGCIGLVEPTLANPASYLARRAEQMKLPQYSTRLERPPKSRGFC